MIPQNYNYESTMNQLADISVEAAGFKLRLCSNTKGWLSFIHFYTSVNLQVGELEKESLHFFLFPFLWKATPFICYKSLSTSCCVMCLYL